MDIDALLNDKAKATTACRTCENREASRLIAGLVSREKALDLGLAKTAIYEIVREQLPGYKLGVTSFRRHVKNCL